MYEPSAEDRRKNNAVEYDIIFAYKVYQLSTLIFPPNFPIIGAKLLWYWIYSQWGHRTIHRALSSAPLLVQVCPSQGLGLRHVVVAPYLSSFCTGHTLGRHSLCPSSIHSLSRGSNLSSGKYQCLVHFIYGACSSNGGARVYKGRWG